MDFEHRSRKRWIGTATCLGLLAANGCLLPRPAPPPPPLPVPLKETPGRGTASDTDRTRGHLPAGPHCLEDLQREARHRNPTVEEWSARVAAQEARSRQVRSGYFPRLRTDGNYLWLDEEIAIQDQLGNRFIVQDVESYTQTTQLTYSVLDWGQVHLLHQSSLQQTLVEEARRRRALQELDLLVARAYYGILALREDLAVNEASVTTLEGALRLARDLREFGRATEADVLVVRARLERRRFQSRRLGDLIRNSEENLARLLDLSPAVVVELQRETSESPVDPGGEDARSAETLAFWEGLALEHRAEFRALEAGHAAVESARVAERRGFLPQVNLFVQHEFSTTESVFRDPNFFSGGVNVAWELFDGFRRLSRLGELVAEAQEIRARYRGLYTAILTEVRRARRSVERAADAVQVAAVVVEHARENLRRVTDLFREGKATGQEVLEAESLLRSEQARAVAARFGALRARAELRFTCGLDYDEDLEDGREPR